jgi:hypothetical protein
MKRLILSITISIFFLSSINAFALKKSTYEEVKSGGSKAYNHLTNHCPFNGTTCKVTIIDKVNVDYVSSHVSGNQYILVFQVSDLNGVGVDDLGNPINVNFASPGYTFSTDEYQVRITQDDEFPALENLVLPLDGKTVDGNGNITFLVTL